MARGIRLPLAQLADAPSGIGASRVEVAQRERAEAIGRAIIRQHALDHPFRGAIGVDRRAGVVLTQRLAVGIAIDRAGRRKYQAVAAGLAHRLEQGQRAGEVVDVVFLRIGNGFADQARCREVHDGHDVMLGEGSGQRGLVGDVADHQRARGKTAVAG
jgi:hypothetical protein